MGGSGPLNVHEFARRLVIWGVACEAVFTIALFVFDEGISAAQQSRIDSQQLTIISLEKRLADRTLTDEQFADVVNQLAPFKGQHFDIVPYWKNPESKSIADRIYNALLKAGWLFDLPKNAEFLLGVDTGVIVSFDKRSDSATKAERALVYTLLANEIYATEDPQSLTFSPPDTEPVSDKLTISVGIKP